MKPALKTAFTNEMAASRAAEAAGDMARAKHHLERAHILGQRRYWSHIQTHFHMFRLARRQADRQEARGQLVRLIGAGPFHLAGWVPIGNTGGADVSATQPMPIPADLQPYLAGHSLRNGLILRGVLAALLAATYLVLMR
jgi:hypothetical protein